MTLHQFPSLLVLGCAVTIGACNPAATNTTNTTTPTPDTRTTRDMNADQIRSVASDVMHHIDAKRWPELERLFADPVATDYTSLFGGSPETQPRAALIATWKSVLARVATQHLLGPITVRVDGDEARAECHVRAMHVAPGAAGGQEWEVFGHYVFTLARQHDAWKVTRLELQTLLQTGNTQLLAQAAANPH